MSFQFPEFYNFPPFFTIQPVESTREKQLLLWKEFILNYVKYTKKCRFEISDTDNPLFYNKNINRRLNSNDIITVINFLAKGGNALYLTNKQKQVVLFSWKTLAEWSIALQSWAVKCGKCGNILTLYEIINGVDSSDTEFYQIDSDLILMALTEVLAKQKKVVLIHGASADETGVKFIA